MSTNATKSSIKIPFQLPTMLSGQDKYLSSILSDPLLLREKFYSNKCLKWFKNIFDGEVFLTKSCTQALELAGQVLDLEPGNEVIMPSFGFVSIANAFVLRGARCRFVDIRKDNMNINEHLIEDAINARTRAIVVINYAGVGCNYEEIIKIAKKHNLYLIEDNALGILAKYNGKYLGSFGDIATFSFDHLKNITCGEGGAIVFNDHSFIARAHINYEFGTNKLDFLQGKVDSYEWKGIGSNYHISELLSAFLLQQLENANEIIEYFMARWNQYKQLLAPLAKEQIIRMPCISSDCKHNAHFFYLFTKSKNERTELIEFLKQRGISATFHYSPLHSSSFGRKHGVFHGEDAYTTSLSETLLRLPLYHSLKEEEVTYITESIFEFYRVPFRT